MNKIVPFQFENFTLRTVVSDDGEILFVGKDAAEALGYKDTVNAIKQHCKGVVKHHPLQTPGGMQDFRVITEPDLYRLVAGSTLSEAQKFESWVFEDVLPSIRKTGKYEAKDTFRLDPVTDQPKVRRANATDPLILQYKQADAVLSSTMKAAKMLGTDKAMARVLAVDAARQKTGIDFGNLLAGNSVEEKPVTPTVLGKDHGWTGKQTNINLETAGYQSKDEDGQWLPTEMGKPFCTVNPYKSPNSAHTGYRVLWCRRVLDAMDQTMTDRQPVTGNVIPMRGATI